MHSLIVVLLHLGDLVPYIGMRSDVRRDAFNLQVRLVGQQPTRNIEVDKNCSVLYTI